MTKETSGKCNTSNKAVVAWVDEMVKLCKPNQRLLVQRLESGAQGADGGGGRNAGS